LYSCTFGILFGFFGGVFAWPEFLIHKLKVNAASYKYHPKLLEKKYHNLQLNNINNKQEFDRKKFDIYLGEITLPHPYFEALLLFIVYLPLIIYLPIKGLIVGPQHSFKLWIYFWEDNFKKGV
tara:strand:- start:932 stop:1300 length:369 start_codon:yes stop_codon:yes gene_type:complete